MEKHLKDSLKLSASNKSEDINSFRNNLIIQGISKMEILISKNLKFNKSKTIYQKIDEILYLPEESEQEQFILENDDQMNEEEYDEEIELLIEKNEDLFLKNTYNKAIKKSKWNKLIE